MRKGKAFTDSDILHGPFPRISCEKIDLIWDPPDWMRKGLTETASGYGSRLNTGFKIVFNGRRYRLYCTCYSNAGSVWFQTKRKRIFVDT